MPYGLMHRSTQTFLIAHAVRSGWVSPNIDFDPTPGHDTDCTKRDDDADCCSRPYADDVYEIAVIFGGALDETFYVGGIYEVNVADLLAEQCREEAAKQDGESWEIIVSEPNDTGVVRYRVSSENEVK
jgi:hypothetical protein